MPNINYVDIDASSAPEFTREPVTIYVMHGGPVVSKNDGDLHYVSAAQLVELYGVDPRCAVDAHRITGGLLRAEATGVARLVHLHPRYDGDYTLPG